MPRKPKPPRKTAAFKARQFARKTQRLARAKIRLAKAIARTL